MQEVSKELKKRVIDKINECVSKVALKHNTILPMISVRYDINSSRLGGQAHQRAAIIRVNPLFLNLYTEDYINDTIPHEVAHIAVYYVYDMKGHYTQAHGQEWKRMMAITFGVEPSRCHDYKVPEGINVGKQKAKYVYRCSRCGASVVAGPKVHAAIQAGRDYWHASCGRGAKLIFVQPAGRVSYSQARAAAQQPKIPQPAPAPNPVPVTPPASKLKVPSTGMSKADQCYGIYLQMRVELMVIGYDTLRQRCIDAFIKDVGMTPAGAATYYSNCKKRQESGG